MIAALIAWGIGFGGVNFIPTHGLTPLPAWLCGRGHMTIVDWRGNQAITQGRGTQVIALWRGTTPICP